MHIVSIYIRTNIRIYSIIVRILIFFYNNFIISRKNLFYNKYTCYKSIRFVTKYVHFVVFYLEKLYVTFII